MPSPGERHGRAKLTAANAQEILRRRAAGERLRSIARAFGVALPTVSMITTGRNWAHLPGPRTIRRPPPGAMRLLVLRSSGMEWKQVAAICGITMGSLEAVLRGKRPVAIDPSGPTPTSIIPLQPSAHDLDAIARLVRRLGGLRPAA